MKKIIYTENGELRIVHPALGARYCQSVVVLGEKKEFAPQTCFDEIVRTYHGYMSELRDAWQKKHPLPSAFDRIKAWFTGSILPLPKEPTAVDLLMPEWSETEDEFVERIFKKDVPATAVNPQIVEETEIPTDRTFRNAWTQQDKKIHIDLEKSKEIVRQNFRVERKPLMEDLDAQYMVALENNDTTTMQTVRTRKNKLRDVTQHQRLTQAQTVEELKALKLIDLIEAKR